MKQYRATAAVCGGHARVGKGEGRTGTRVEVDEKGKGSGARVFLRVEPRADVLWQGGARWSEYPALNALARD